MIQPSPRSQFHGKNAKVQRLPVTLSMSPPTFSMPRMPFLNRMRWTGSHSGKSSFQSRPPDHLHLLLDEPLTGRGYETGRPAEIVFAILVELVPAGVDDDDVARAHDVA